VIRAGLTGGIACGKSKALLCFERLGAYTIDADEVARDVVRSGLPAYDGIIAEFGSSFVGPNQELDRAKLGELVFTDDSARSRLNAIVHPFVLGEEDRIVEELVDSPHKYPMVVTDAALMVEVGTYTKYDVVLAVYCPPSLQLERLMKRNNLTVEDARMRMLSQMPLLEKVKKVDYVIDTTRDYTDTQEQIGHLYRELLIRYGEE
jgi:dephospho-CoA kinase